MSAGLALISCKQFPFRIYWGDFPQFQLPLENERLSRKLLWYQCTVIQPSQRYQPASTAPWFIDGVYINPDIIPSSIVSLSNIITSHWVYSILTFPLWFSQASQLKGRVKFHPPPRAQTVAVFHKTQHGVGFHWFSAGSAPGRRFVSSPNTE